MTAGCLERLVLANLLTDEVSSWGNASGEDLVRSLVGDSESVRALNASLEGQRLPRLWRQGQFTCIVSKPTNDALVLGILRTDASGVVGVYHASRAIDDAVKALFS